MSTGNFHEHKIIWLKYLASSLRIAKPFVSPTCAEKMEELRTEIFAEIKLLEE